MTKVTYIKKEFIEGLIVPEGKSMNIMVGSMAGGRQAGMVLSSHLELPS